MRWKKEEEEKIGDDYQEGRELYPFGLALLFLDETKQNIIYMFEG